MFYKKIVTLIVVSVLSVLSNLALAQVVSPDACDRSEFMKDALAIAGNVVCDGNDIFTNLLLNSLITASGNFDITSASVANADILATDFNNFAALTNLDLSGNALTQDLDISLIIAPGKAPGITILDVSNNAITSFPTGFCSASGLETLILSDNTLAAITPSDFTSCTNIKNLFLTNTAISPPAGILGNLPNLELLDIGANSLSSLPANFFPTGHGLKGLRAGANNADFAIPVNLVVTTKELNAANNFNTTFTIDIPSGMPLTQTYTITATNADVSHGSLELAIGTTQSIEMSLQSTSAAAPVLTVTPSGFPADTCYDTLDCYTGFSLNTLVVNDITYTNDALGDPLVCERTDAIQTAILAAVSKTCDDAITLEDLAGITSLTVTGGSLGTLLNTDFNDLIALTTLQLSSNGISSIPDDFFANLPTLVTVDLDDNTISVLNKAHFDGSKITDFSIENNQIASLPDDLVEGHSDFSSMTSLDVAGNPITSNGNRWVITTVDLIEVDKLSKYNYSNIEIPYKLPFSITVLLSAGDGAITSVTNGLLSVPNIVIDSGFTSPKNILSNGASFTSQDENQDNDAVYIITAADTLTTWSNIPITVKGDTLQINVEPPSSPLVCSRTQAIQDAILAALSQTCADNSPIDAADVAGITSLTVTGGSLETLDVSDFNDLDALTSLTLSSNGISTLPADLDNLDALTTLVLSYNSISSIPDDFLTNLPALETLNLDNNTVSVLKKEHFDSTAVSDFSIANNSIASLPSDLMEGNANFASMSSLNVAGNPITTNDNRWVIGAATLEATGKNGAAFTRKLSIPYALPFSIPFALTIENGSPASGLLDITAGNTQNSITYTADNVDRFHGITAAELSDTWGNVPYTITGDSLELNDPAVDYPVCDRTAYMRDAIVAALTPAQACEDIDRLDLESITSIDLSFEATAKKLVNNDFEVDGTYEAFNDYHGLVNVVSLDLSNNALDAIYSDILPSLGSLTYMNLSGNSFTALPTNVCSQQPGITEYDLSNISTITAVEMSSLSGCSGLITLNLSDTGVTELPANLVTTFSSTLVNLNVENSKMTTLPDGFFPSNHNLKTIKFGGSQNNGVDFSLPFIINYDASATNLQNDPDLGLHEDVVYVFLNTAAGAPRSHSVSYEVEVSQDAEQVIEGNNAGDGLITETITVTKGQTKTINRPIKINDSPYEFLIYQTLITGTTGSVADPSNCGDSGNDDCYSGLVYSPTTLLIEYDPVFNQDDIDALLETFYVFRDQPLGQINLDPENPDDYAKNITLPTASAGPAAVYSLEGISDDGDIQFLPDSLTFSGTGFYAPSNYEYNYVITNGLGKSHSVPVKFHVSSPFSKPTLTEDQQPEDIEVTSAKPFNITLAETDEFANHPITYHLTLQGFDNELPAETSFDPETRVFSYTGAAFAFGPGPLVYSITDSYSETPDQTTDTETYVFNYESIIQEVLAFADGESIADITSVNVDSQAALPEVANGTQVVYSISGLPTGMNFDPDTRQLSGSTKNAAETTYAITYTATDNLDATLSLTFNIIVPADTTPAFADPDENANYPAYQLAAFSTNLPTVVNPDENAPLTYSLSDQPGWLSFDKSTHEISGTPGENDNSRVMTLTATDGNGDSTTKTIVININIQVTPAFKTAPTSFSVRSDLNSPFTRSFPKLEGTNGALTYEFSTVFEGTTSNSLNVPGIFLDIDTTPDSLTGIPTQPGTYDITLTLGDDDGYDVADDFTEYTFTITVFEPFEFADDGEVTNANTTIGRINTQVDAADQVIVPAPTGGNIPYTETIEGLPEGLTLSDYTIGGTSTESGNFSVTWEVSDKDDYSISKNFWIVVNPELSFANNDIADTLQSASTGNSYSLTLPKVKPGNTDNLVFTVTGDLPDGLTTTIDTAVSGGSVIISGTPTAETSAATVNYTVTDSSFTPAVTIELSFELSVITDLTPAFDTAVLPAIISVINQDIVPVQFPEITTAGNEPITYQLLYLPLPPTEDNPPYPLGYTLAEPFLSQAKFLPDELKFDPETRILTGKITEFGHILNDKFLYRAIDADGDIADFVAADGVNIKLVTIHHDLNDFGVTIDGSGENYYFDIGEAFTGENVIALPGLTVTDNNQLNNPITYTTSGELPPGLTSSVANNVRTISGTIESTATGTYEFTYTASDIDDDSDSLTHVFHLDLTPTFADGASIADYSVVEGEQFTIENLPQLNTNGNDPATYMINRTQVLGGVETLETIPSTWTFAGNQGTLSIPDSDVYVQDETYPLHYFAQDANGDLTAILDFDLTIENDIQPGFAEDASITESSVIEGELIDSIDFPTLETLGNGNADEHSYNVEFSNGDPLPATLNFDAANRVLSGTVGSAGTYNFDFIGLDKDSDAVKLAFSIQVLEDTQPAFADDASINDISRIAGVSLGTTTLPELTTLGNGDLSEHSYTLTFSNGDAIPATLVFNAADRELSGSIGVGSYTLEYNGTDLDGDSVSLTFNIEIVADLLPEFASSASISDVSVLEGESIDTITFPDLATVGNGDMVYTLHEVKGNNLVDIPDAWEYNNQQTFTATAVLPTDVYADYDYDLRYIATDENGDQATLDFTIAVEYDNAVTSFDTVSNNEEFLSGAMVDIALPNVSNGNAPITYTASSGLPNGLSYSENDDKTVRKITGATAAVGTFTFVLTATDIDAETATYTLTLEVTATGELALSGYLNNDYPDQYPLIGETSTLELPEGIGGKGALTLTLVEDGTENLPTGLDFNDETRVLTLGDDAIDVTLNYTVTDAFGTAVSDTFQLVYAADVAPVFASNAAQVYAITVIAGEPITDVVLPLVETPGNGPTTTYSVLENAVIVLPPSLSYNSDTRVLSGSVDNAGDFSVSYLAVDSDGDFALLQIPITVSADTTPEFSDSQINHGSVLGDTVAIALPDAVGGNPTVTYELTGDLPTGLTFTPAEDGVANSINGSTQATDPQVDVTLTWTATDANGDTDTIDIVLNIQQDLTPVFTDTSIDDVQAYTSKEFSVILPIAQDGNGDTTYSLTFSDDTAVPPTYLLSGNTLTTQIAEAGTVSLKYLATDTDGDTAVLTFNINIVQNSVPVFLDANDDNIATLDITFAINIPIETTIPLAINGNGIVTYSLDQDLPAGLQFNSTSGLLNGTVADAIDLAITLTAQDEDGDTAALELLILALQNKTPKVATDVPVPVAPVFGSGDQVNIALPRVIHGDSPTIVTFTHTYSAEAPQSNSQTNSETNFAIVPLVVTDGLPLGLEYSTTIENAITGAVEVLGYYTIVMTLTDITGILGEPDTFSIEFTLNIQAAVEFALIQGNVTASTGVQVALVLPEATGGTNVYTYSLNSDALPAGLNFNPDNRTISGATNNVGISELTYTVNDSGEGMTSALFNLTVIRGPLAFESSVDDQILDVNATVNLILPEAKGGDGGYTYALTGLPDDFSFDNLTRTISGIADEGSINALTYTVLDSDDSTDNATVNFNWSVLPLPLKFESTVENLTLELDSTVNITLPEATGPDGENIYSLTGDLPADLSFNATARTITGTATAHGTFPLTYSVTNGDLSNSAEFDLIVSVVPLAFITNIADISVEHESAVNITLPEATGAVGEYIYSLTDGLPAGLSFNATERTITGTTTVNGTFALTYTVASGEFNRSEEFDLTVLAALAFITEIVDISLELDSTVNIVLPEATGGVGEYIYSLTDLPADLSFNADERTITGTTTVNGTFSLTYTVSTETETASDVFNLTVVAALAFETNIADISLDLVSAVSITLPEATGAVGEYIYSLNASLPTGLSFNADERTITGTPTQEGIFSLTYMVTSGEFNLSLEFNLNVLAEALPLLLAAPDGMTLVLSAETSIVLPEATGGEGPYTYELTGNLPTGLSFDATERTITGVPTQEGTFELTYMVSTETEIASNVFNLTVVAALALASPEDQTINRNESTSSVLPEATDGEDGYTYTLTGNIPDGLSFNDSTRTLSGTPTVNGTFQMTYTVTDSADNTASAGFTWTVVTPALEFEVPAVDLTINLDAINTLVLPEGKGGEGGYTYTLSGALPTGLSFNSATRTISGTTSVQGTFELTYTIEDSAGTTIEVTFNLIVQQALLVFDSTADDQTLTVGETVNLVLPSADTSGLTVTYAVAGLPNGIDFNSATRALTGSPEQLGIFDVTYTATDDLDRELAQTFTVTVVGDDQIVQDILWRQALYIAESTSTIVKRRFSLIGQKRYNYEEDSFGKAANFQLGQSSWLSFWFTSDSGSLDNSLTNGTRSWDGSVDLTNIGLDYNNKNFLAGFMQQTVSTSSSFSITDADTLNQRGTLDIDNLAVTSFYGGYTSAKFSAWASSSSGSGDATLSYQSSNGNVVDTASTTADYSASTLGLNYNVGKPLSVGFESIASASLDLSSDNTFTNAATNSASRTKVYATVDVAAFSKANTGKWALKLGLASRSDSADLAEGSYSESGLETTFQFEYRLARVSLDVGIRNFSAEDYSESGTWFSVQMAPKQDEGLSFSYRQSVGSDQSRTNSLFSNQEVSTMVQSLNASTSGSSLLEVGYNFKLNSGMMKLYTQGEGSDRDITNIAEMTPTSDNFNWNSIGLQFNNQQSMTMDLQFNQHQELKLTGRINF